MPQCCAHIKSQNYEVCSAHLCLLFAVMCPNGNNNYPKHLYSQFSATSNAFLYMNFNQLSICFCGLHLSHTILQIFHERHETFNFFWHQVLNSHVIVFFISYEKSRITWTFVIFYDSTFTLNNWLSHKCVKMLYYVTSGYLSLTFSFFCQK
jgi:hypothetical protein